MSTGDPHHFRAPSLGEIHQEIEQEQEAQVVRCPHDFVIPLEHGERLGEKNWFPIGSSEHETIILSELKLERKGSSYIDTD